MVIFYVILFPDAVFSHHLKQMPFHIQNIENHYLFSGTLDNSPCHYSFLIPENCYIFVLRSPLADFVRDLDLFLGDDLGTEMVMVREMGHSRPLNRLVQPLFLPGINLVTRFRQVKKRGKGN
jgi:hypothetical protein